MNMYRILLVILFCFVTVNASAQNSSDTFHMYFDLNVAALNQNTQKKIDILIYNDKIINGSSIMIVGYADYLGTEGYNKNLSMERAEHVKNYLVKYGINTSDIKVCLGKGEVERQGLTDKGGYPTDRRVDIVVNNRTKKPHVPPVKPKQGQKPKTDTVLKVTTTDIDEVSKLEVGSTIRLQNVYFPVNRHYLEPTSYATLEKLFVILKDNPGIKISIEGHVCCIRPDAPDALDIDSNSPTLSVNRARAIYDYLVRKGIDPSRLEYMGFAKRKPVIIDERTEEDKEKNRRVEIRITENKLHK